MGASASVPGAWCIARRWTRRGVSRAGPWSPPASCAPVREATWTTSDWAGFVHDAGDGCRRQLWLDERGTTGDLADLVVRCECGKRRRLYEAAERDRKPLGACRGARPWLGRGTNEECGQPSRLLIRTASNAYFPQLVSVLSLPDPEAAAGRTEFAELNSPIGNSRSQGFLGECSTRALSANPNTAGDRYDAG